MGDGTQAPRMPLEANLSPHFTLAQMVRSQTAIRMGIDNRPTPEEVRALTDLCQYVLEPAREILGAPILVSSGFRCAQLNQLIGGAENSQHVMGQAVDFTAAGISNANVIEVIRRSALPYDQLIAEFGEAGWVHVSYGPRSRRQVLRAYRDIATGRTLYAPLEGLPA